MSDERTRNRLRDILSSVQHIREYIKGMSREAFLDNDEKQDAVIRRLEIISEAQKGIADEVKARHPHLPWRQIHAAGNLYRHEYFRIDPVEIWDTVTGPSLSDIECFARVELGLGLGLE